MGYLFARFRGGFTVAAPNKQQCAGTERNNCTSRALPLATETGYSEAWRKRVVADGDNKGHYAVPPAHQADSTVLAANRRKILRMQKMREDTGSAHAAPSGQGTSTVV